MSTAAQQPVGDDRRRAWYAAAVGAAVVGALFSAIVGARMIAAYRRMQVVHPQESPELAQLREQIRRRPDEIVLAEQARKHDLALRQAYFRAKHFVDTGAYLLAGGAGLCLVGVLVAGAIAAQRPRPGPAVDVRKEDAGRASVARWTLGAVILAAAGGSAALLAWSTPPAPLEVRRAAAGPRQPVGPVSPRPTTRPAPTDWPRFRGPGGLGIAVGKGFAERIVTGEGGNVLWKTPVPLPGKNSPIVSRGRVYLTGATKTAREVYCFDAGTGRLLWRSPVKISTDPAPPEVFDDTGYAAPTAVTDGQRVCAIFANGDLACFDRAGKKLWAKSLGKPTNMYGHSSSLTIYDGLLLVLYDQAAAEDERSVLLALDVKTGEEIWSALRAVGNSWASPIVIHTRSGAQVVTCADPWVIAYNADDGSELWKADCLTGDVAPSPVYAGGRLYATNIGAVLAAIRPGGEGDVTKTHVAWTAEDGLPDITSPLSDGRQVYLLTTDGVLTCYDAKTGKLHYEKELDRTFIASPSLVGDRVYLLAAKGTLIVFRAGPKYVEIARSELGERCEASPALLGGRIYIRANKHLYCIGGRN